MARTKKPKKKKEKLKPVDGIGEKELKNLRRMIRQAWQWSTAWRIAKARAIGKDGYPRCEGCGKKVPKTFVDHKAMVGVIDDGFIRRMFVPSSELQNLCKKCHAPKTKAEQKYCLANPSPYLNRSIPTLIEIEKRIDDLEKDIGDFF